MTGGGARVRALAAAGEVVRSLSHACHTRSLYPAAHPQQAEAARTLVDAVDRLRAASAGDPTLFARRGALRLGATLLARESLSHYRLAVELQEAGVESVTFGPGTSAGDLGTLVAIVAGDHPLVDRVGGLAVNHAQLPSTGEQGWADRLAELRRSYAATLDMLHRSTAHMDQEGPLDLEVATAVVGDLVDGISDDPGFGLLLSAIKSHDDYTHIHMVNVCVLSVALGNALGLAREQVMALGVGGLLHDIGKLQIPGGILTSPDALNEEEWRLVQRHPAAGAGLLFATSEGFAHPAAVIALEHHAAYDASGYPPLLGRLPSLPARLVAVADCFDALTSKRSYRGPLDRTGALSVIGAGAGRGFDPRVVGVFRHMIGPYPVGSIVQLDSSEIGVVVGSSGTAAGEPVVLIILDTSGTPAPAEERDLGPRDAQGQPRWTITRRVDPSEHGIDLSRLVLSGELTDELTDEPDAGTPGGLVHEPSPGEAHPEGYVDTHANGHAHEVRIDPDVAPPFDG